MNEAKVFEEDGPIAVRATSTISNFVMACLTVSSQNRYRMEDRDSFNFSNLA